MSHYDLTDLEWRVIAPSSPNKPRGVPKVGDRRVLNGSFRVLRPSALWRDLRERYEPTTTRYDRFVRWRRAGVWDWLMGTITEAYDGDIQMIDNTSVRVHQQSATTDLRTLQILLDHTKIENTVRYLGIDVKDAMTLAEGTEFDRDRRPWVAGVGNASFPPS